jgi:hypothetical protein
MSELSPKAVYATMQEDSRQGPLAKTLLIARIIAITAAVGGAVPTAIRLYHSWANGIPFNEVSHRLEQAAMWEKNFDCKIDYQALTTAQGLRVDAGACSKTGDVALKVTTAAGKAIYEWIALTKLQKAGTTSASAWGLLASSAMASEGPDTAGGLILAQATAPPAGGQSSGMKVICQAMPSKSVILRVVQEGPKCYREQVSLYQGNLQKRDEVACTTPCK